MIEAEAGGLGSEFVTGLQDGATYITITSSGAGGAPGSSERVATYHVTFPAAGTYQLYARVYVGPSTFDDDSFFYRNGIRSDVFPSDADDWVTINQLAGASGYTEVEQLVLDTGAAGSEVWKWINCSTFSGAEAPTDFIVPDEALAQVFQLGGREDGLLIDKFAFGRQGVYFTVSDLDEGTPGTTELPPGPEIRKGPPMATGKSKWLGCVWSNSQIANFENYFNQVTPENAGKWGSVEGTRDQMNWSGLDSAYNLARENGFTYRHHVLMWGGQQPDWISSLPSAEQLEEIREWFVAVASRYPEIDYLEVVNEPLHDPPDDAEDGGYIDALGGSGVTGWDWIITAFEMAREIFPPTVKLMINEYGIVNDTAATTRYLEIINLLKERDLIDAIGVQAHAFSTTGSMATVRSNLDRLGATGLSVMATEMDIDGPTDGTQLADYQRIFPTFWEHPSIVGITLWGYRPGLWRNDEGAYLALADNTERPALAWLQNYVASIEPLTFARYLAVRGLDPALHPFSSDLDGDGIIAGLEYLLGTSPVEAEGIQPVKTVTQTGGQTIEGGIHIDIAGGLNEGYIVIERSTDLTLWTVAGTYNFATREATGDTVLDAAGTSVWIENTEDIDGAPVYFRATFSLAPTP